MHTRPRLTAALITLDEQARLPGLLAQLTWADEVVVVDGGSRDATAEIARQNGAEVAIVPFSNYAAQRNCALDLAGGDWVLSIDADESPQSGLAEEIRDRIANPDYAAYRVPIRSRIFGRSMRYSGTQDDDPVRLFRRDAGRWHGAVHERLAIEGRVGRLTRGLNHDTLPDLPSFLAKMNRYTTLEANRRVLAGHPPSVTDFYLAPPLEFARRLIRKAGILDGPEGWAFCALSGLSQWLLARRHRELWREQEMSGRAAAAVVQREQTPDGSHGNLETQNLSPGETDPAFALLESPVVDAASLARHHPSTIKA